jgi:hypothetical protein
MSDTNLSETTEHSNETSDKKLVHLQLEEQQLKLDELKLKIADLKKPEYRKFSFWTSTLAIVIALGGILGQNVLSNIKSERAALELKEATNKKDSAERAIRAYNDSLKDLETARNFARQEYDLLSKKLDTAQKSLVYTLAELDKLPKTKQRDSITTALKNTQAKLNEIPGRVYIQIADESERSSAKTLQNALLTNNFLAPGIENVSRLHAQIPGKTEVRYYRDGEKDEAISIIKILQRLKIGEPINDMPQKISDNSGNNRPGHFEIWFTEPR